MLVCFQMDLSPAFAKFYLAQINPILGQIVGPSISRDDLPDVVMHLTPDEMVWPCEEYSIRIEPMKVVCDPSTSNYAVILKYLGFYFWFGCITVSMYLCIRY